jgi:hypothetical protein
MKNWILTGLAMVITTTQLLAQGVGIEAGVGFNSLRGSMHGSELHSSLRPALRAGIVAEEPISDALAFQYGAFYSARGGNIAFTNAFDDNGIPVRQETNGYIRVDYLEVPLSLLYQKRNANDSRIVVGGGPYIAVAFGGLIGFDRDFHSNGNTKRFSALMPASIGEDEDFRRFDAGLQLHAGYEILKGIYARGRATYGLVDINPTPTGEMKNMGFALTLGYMIR